jgi:hypothetical protein
MSKLQFLIKKNIGTVPFKILCGYQSPLSGTANRKNSRSGSACNHCGSETPPSGDTLLVLQAGRPEL